MVDSKYGTLKNLREKHAVLFYVQYTDIFPSRLNISYIASGQKCTIFEK